MTGPKFEIFILVSKSVYNLCTGAITTQKILFDRRFFEKNFFPSLALNLWIFLDKSVLHSNPINYFYLAPRTKLYSLFSRAWGAASKYRCTFLIFLQYLSLRMTQSLLRLRKFLTIFRLSKTGPKFEIFTLVSKSVYKLFSIANTMLKIISGRRFFEKKFFCPIRRPSGFIEKSESSTMMDNRKIASLWGTQ